MSSTREEGPAYAAALQRLGWLPARLAVASSFRDRLLGIVGPLVRDAPGSDSVVLAFPSCDAVHTCFMGQALDIAFIDAAGHVLEEYRSVGPWRFLRCRGSFSVLERIADTRGTVRAPKISKKSEKHA